MGVHQSAAASPMGETERDLEVGVVPAPRASVVMTKRTSANVLPGAVLDLHDEELDGAEKGQARFGRDAAEAAHGEVDATREGVSARLLSQRKSVLSHRDANDTPRVDAVVQRTGSKESVNSTSAVSRQTDSPKAEQKTRQTTFSRQQTRRMDGGVTRQQTMMSRRESEPPEVTERFSTFQSSAPDDHFFAPHVYTESELALIGLVQAYAEAFLSRKVGTHHDPAQFANGAV